MVLRFVGRLAWGTSKFALKHVVIPLVYTAAMAAAISAAAEKIREKTAEIEAAEGTEPTIRPEP